MTDLPVRPPFFTGRPGLQPSQSRVSLGRGQDIRGDRSECRPPASRDPGRHDTAGDHHKCSGGTVFAPGCQGAGPVQGPSRVRAGVLARKAAGHATPKGHLASFPSVRTTKAAQGRAVQLQAELASCGQHRALSLGDALAAAVAERLDLVVPHYDADCDRAGAATGQPHQWAVPRDLPTNDPERRPGRHPPRVNEKGNAGAPHHRSLGASVLSECRQPAHPFPCRRGGSPSLLRTHPQRLAVETWPRARLRPCTPAHRTASDCQICRVIVRSGKV